MAVGGGVRGAGGAQQSGGAGDPPEDPGGDWQVKSAIINIMICIINNKEDGRVHDSQHSPETVHFGSAPGAA